jgi:hypothetical protein
VVSFECLVTFSVFDVGTNLGSHAVANLWWLS